MYSVAKGKTKLLECGLLNNGGVGGNDEIRDGEEHNSRVACNQTELIHSGLVFVYYPYPQLYYVLVKCSRTDNL